MQPVEDPLLARIREVLQAPLNTWTIHVDKSEKPSKDSKDLKDPKDPKDPKELKKLCLRKRAHPDPKITIHQWMTEVDLPVGVSEASSMINKIEPRRKWDKTLDKFEELEDGIIFFTTFPVLGGIISGRYFYQRRVFRTLPDGTEICATESIKYDKRPPPKGLVEGWAHGNGVMITPNATGCTVRMLACVDPKGWLPRVIAEGGAGKVLTQIMSDWAQQAKAMIKT
jgi:hypothetical protein